MTKEDLVYRLVRLIPRGRVSTYGLVAQATGLGNPRFVGWALHRNPDPRLIPCHRVVRSDGRLAKGFTFGGLRAQARLLNVEGVTSRNGLIDLKRYLWQPSKPLHLFLGLLARFSEPGPWPWFEPGVGHSAEEVVIGSVLTQNTNWRNVEYALSNLRRAGVCSLAGILSLGLRDEERLRQLVRPSGFYRQKAERLFLLAKFIVKDHSSLANFLKLPLNEARQRLLGLKGIGPETADTILLFAGNKTTFVIDNYTKRLVRKYKLTKDLDYDNLQRYFESNLPEDIGLYKDFHALIITWAKDK